MRLLILAGGFGTRLRGTIVGVPKALAPIGVVPFLHLQIENWLKQGLREFTFLLHHQADQIICFLKSEHEGLFKGCQVDWVIEPAPMDTGGAVAYAVKSLNIKGNFLVTNADTWLGGGIREMMLASGPSMAVIKLSDVSRYGQVYFDFDQRVRVFAEKKGEHVAGWINAGLYHLNSDLFDNSEGIPFSLERDLFAQLVQNDRLNAMPLETDFIDIGVPADYHQFCQWVAAGRKELLCN